MLLSKISSLQNRTEQNTSDDMIEIIRNLQIYSITIATILSIYALIYYFYFKVPTIAYSCFALTFTCFMTVPIYRKTHSSEIATNNLMVSGMLSVAIAAWYTGGFESPSLNWIYCAPIVSAVFCGRKSFILWSITSVVILLFYFMIEAFYGQIPSPIHPKHLDTIRFLATIGPVITLAFFTKVFVNNRQKSLDQLKEKQDEVNRLLQMVSHDLCNPNMLISAYSEISLEDKNLNEKQKQQWQKISKASQTITSILMKVKESLELQTGKKKVNFEAMSIEDAVEHSKFIFERSLKNKNINLKYINCLNNQEKISVDEVIFKNQIFNNIISNAIKFSNPNEEITIKVGHENNKIKIEIIDKGIGIPRPLLDKIFSNFQATTRKGTNGETGTGFGMPLVKSYVEMLSGEIKIESKSIEEHPENHGSNIQLYFKKAA